MFDFSQSLKLLRVASLFATGQNKKIIDENLKSFCKEKGATWILKLMD
jgi:hypothetical protein